jgi:hypothetical protein
LGIKQTAIKRDRGVDIGVKISFDGKWIAFGRTIGYFSGKYGKCDCMAFDRFDIYIARIDGALPARSVKIGHGYCVGLYVLQGKRHLFIPLSASSKHTIFLQGISDGRYVLKIESSKNSIQKAVLITR